MAQRKTEKPAAQEGHAMNERTWERTMRRALAVPPPPDEKPADKPKRRRKPRQLSSA